MQLVELNSPRYWYLSLAVLHFAGYRRRQLALGPVRAALSDVERAQGICDVAENKSPMSKGINVCRISPQKTFCIKYQRSLTEERHIPRTPSLLLFDVADLVQPRGPNSSAQRHSSSFRHLGIPICEAKKGDPPAWVWIGQISVSDQ